MPETFQQTVGFDAPVFKSEDDHLHRWPLACQIYNVAANGPLDWSVRIGVYGEWGTGKTSALKFVAAMAEAGGHIPVWFDPWEFSNKVEMWRSYVKAVYKSVEAKLGKLEEGHAVRKRELIAKVGGVLAKIAGLWADHATDLANDGLELVKQHLSSQTEDLANLRHVLNGKRVFVLVDDLDRTAAELVPEILFALKEVMDIPGFSFVCGFDPLVIGKILGETHKGFADGMKFLEKIIDYPVWLPLATPEGLMKIALADAARHCPFVPTEEVRQVIPFLPPNPRAVRQFIRFLSLLENQIERHYAYELRWPVILTSTVIKIRHPKLADRLLNDRQFWQELSMTEMMLERSNDHTKLKAQITSHIQKSEADQTVTLSQTEKDQIYHGIRLILSSLNLWTSSDLNMISGQMSITESPQAVTWKEFEECVKSCKTGPLGERLKTWIMKHAQAQRFREGDVANELSRAAIERYRSELHNADNAFKLHQKALHRQCARLLISMIEELALKTADLIPSLRSREWLPLATIFGDLIPLANAISPVHAELWPRTERLLVNLAKNWPGELHLLHRGVRSVHPDRSGWVDSVEDRRVAQFLNKLLDERLAKVVTAGLAENGFVERMTLRSEETYEYQEIIIRPSSALWTTFKSKVLKTLRKAKRNATVQDNAHAFLSWIEHLLRTRKSVGLASAEEILGNQEIITAIWNAATATPFAGRYAYRLRELPAKIKEFGVDLIIPTWWQPAIDETLILYKREAELKQTAESV